LGAVAGGWVRGRVVVDVRGACSSGYRHGFTQHHVHPQGSIGPEDLGANIAAFTADTAYNADIATSPTSPAIGYSQRTTQR